MKKAVICSRGGGVKSATAIGALLALKEANIEISKYSGTSIGAVIMSLAASGIPEEKVHQLFLEYVEIYSNASRTRGGKGSLVIEQTVNEKCRGLRFKDLDKPLYISANAGGLWFTRPFVFCKETTPEVTLGEACRASSSFPIVYEHYKMDSLEEKFWDGGMAINPFVPPITDEERSIVVSFRKKKINYKTRYLKAWLEPEKKCDILIKPYVGEMGTLGDRRDIEHACLCGYNATRQAIGGWK